MIKQVHRLWKTSLFIVCLAAVGLFGDAVSPRPGLSAEKIRFLVGGPLVFSLSVDALATFAETGEITGNFKTYARFLNDETLEMLRQGLNQPLPLDLLTVDHLAYSPLGREAIFNVGKVIRIHPKVNGFYGLRAAVIGAAAQAGPEGWTMIEAMQQFPTKSIDIRVGDLLRLRRELAVYFSYNQAVVEAIQTQAAAEAATQPPTDLATLADLSQPGPYRVVKETVIVENPAVRQTGAGLTVNYDFPVDVYLPQGLGTPAPIVIVSHGFGDVKESFTFIVEHLASHGFIGIIPNHVGSDLSYRKEYLEGRLNTLLSPMEFINRPQEITFLIDQLERLVSTSPTWATRLNLERIGVMGDSLGGSTVLALAGAEINYARLTAACDADNLILNFSLYLECRARFLPPQNYQLRDRRIKAVLTTHPVGGYLYGPEGMSQIEIPLMMISGSHDIVSPLVTEQIHPFIWLRSNPKYLALLNVGTHFSSKPGRDSAAGIFKLIAGENRDVGSRYSKTISTAFWHIYLQDQPEYSPYLTASYAKAASQGQPMQLDIIQSLAPTQLETAYGRKPPIPVIPAAIAATPPARDQSILAEIERTGVLKVAFRQDAAPFGYINPANEWDGYCGDMAIALGDHLSQKLDLPIGIEVVELTSTLQTRFDLVRNDHVHLECGPNTIRQDVEGIAFSNPVFTASAQFLAPKGQESTVNPNLPLSGVRLGVMAETTTETFVQNTYPGAKITRFTGPEARQEAVQAVSAGQIDAFVGDGILSYAELLRQNLPLTSFSVIPETPLTCEYYGLILPNDDPEWKTTIDQFMGSESKIHSEWLGDALPYVLDATDYCLNR